MLDKTTLGIAIWQAVVDETGPVSCNAISLSSAAHTARKMADASQKVIALTDGEIKIEGEDLAALLENPHAIHMHNSKLYDSGMTYKLGSGLRAWV